MEEDIYGNVDRYKDPASDEQSLYSQLKAWGVKTIKRTSLKQVYNSYRGGARLVCGGGRGGGGGEG